MGNQKSCHRIQQRWLRYVPIILLICSNGYCADSAGTEVLVDFDKKSLPVINDELRRTSRRLRDHEGGIHINTGTTGILTVDRGGTGQDFSAVTMNTVTYFSSDGVMSASPSSQGSTIKFLRGDFTWAEATYLKLVSTTTITASANSGDIEIDPTKNYRVVFNITAPPNNDIPAIRFNSDATTNAYGYVYRTLSTGAVAADVGDAAADEIRMASATSNATDSETQGEFYLLSQSTSNSKRYQVRGSLWGESAADSPRYSEFYGFWGNTATGSSFEMFFTGGGTYTGKIYLYEMVK